MNFLCSTPAFIRIFRLKNNSYSFKGSEQDKEPSGEPPMWRWVMGDNGGAKQCNSTAGRDIPV